MPLTIGDVTIKHGIFLAPMAGVTDRSFRTLCRRHGAEYTVSEMVSAKSLCYEQKSRKTFGTDSKSAAIAAVYKSDLPLSIQLFGCEPDFMAEAAAMIESSDYKGCVSDCPPSAIDINMGCPVRKITSNGEGSALMKNISLASDIVRNITNAIHIPVTVKIRAGWDSESVNAPEFAKAMEDAGASAVFVHARTKEQLYSPGIDLSVIEKVKRAVTIPVIGNGDIYTAADALRMLRETGCDGVMVARGSLGNPWIFDEITAVLEGKDFVPPSGHQKFDTALEQLQMMISEKGERTGTAEAKKHIAWYIKGISGAAAARLAIMSSTSSNEIRDIIKRISYND